MASRSAGTANGSRPLSLGDHGDTIMTVPVNCDGERSLRACWNGPVRLRDAKSARSRLTFRGHQDGLYAACFSPDGKRSDGARLARQIGQGRSSASLQKDDEGGDVDEGEEVAAGLLVARGDAA